MSAEKGQAVEHGKAYAIEVPALDLHELCTIGEFQIMIDILQQGVELERQDNEEQASSLIYIQPCPARGVRHHGCCLLHEANHAEQRNQARCHSRHCVGSMQRREEDGPRNQGHDNLRQEYDVEHRCPIPRDEESQLSPTLDQGAILLGHVARHHINQLPALSTQLLHFRLVEAKQLVARKVWMDGELIGHEYGRCYAHQQLLGVERIVHDFIPASQFNEMTLCGCDCATHIDRHSARDLLQPTPRGQICDPHIG
mmetsp:Transcript_52283/g.124720  ORF Transcript_52283/g.124720 Transcript_52283/m.124720 type:complete len:255 (-) Transcript_52283:549-1313(-)